MTKVLAAVAVCLLLAGCGATPSAAPTAPHVINDDKVNRAAESFWVDTIDGRRIPCVRLDPAISCDWSAK